MLKVGYLTCLITLPSSLSLEKPNDPSSGVNTGDVKVAIPPNGESGLMLKLLVTVSLSSSKSNHPGLPR